MTNQALPFSPLGAAVSITTVANATSASTALPGSGGNVCRVVNQNANPLAVAFSNTSGGAVASATSGVIIPASSVANVSMPIGTVDVATYGIGAGTSACFLTRGDGGIS